MAIRRRLIERLATEALASAGQTRPPIDVEAIAHRFGLTIGRRRLESDLSGFLYNDGKRAVIGVNTTHAHVRQRFTVAHELGHYLLHSDDSVHIDRRIGEVEIKRRDLVRRRDLLSSAGVDAAEIEANIFAAQLLMPRKMLAKDLQDVETLRFMEDDEAVRGLAEKYDVSQQAMLLRLTNLGYIPPM